MAGACPPGVKTRASAADCCAGGPAGHAEDAQDRSCDHPHCSSRQRVRLDSGTCSCEEPTVPGACDSSNRSGLPLLGCLLRESDIRISRGLRRSRGDQVIFLVRGVSLLGDKQETEPPGLPGGSNPARLEADQSASAGAVKDSGHQATASPSRRQTRLYSPWSVRVAPAHE